MTTQKLRLVVSLHLIAALVFAPVAQAATPGAPPVPNAGPNAPVGPVAPNNDQSNRFKREDDIAAKQKAADKANRENAKAHAAEVKAIQAAHAAELKAFEQARTQLTEFAAKQREKAAALRESMEEDRALIQGAVAHAETTAEKKMPKGFVKVELPPVLAEKGVQPPEVYAKKGSAVEASITQASVLLVKEKTKAEPEQDSKPRFKKPQFAGGMPEIDDLYKQVDGILTGRGTRNEAVAKVVKDKADPLHTKFESADPQDYAKEYVKGGVDLTAYGIKAEEQTFLKDGKVTATVRAFSKKTYFGPDLLWTAVRLGEEDNFPPTPKGILKGLSFPENEPEKAARQVSIVVGTSALFTENPSRGVTDNILAAYRWEDGEVRTTGGPSRNPLFGPSGSLAAPRAFLFAQMLLPLLWEEHSAVAAAHDNPVSFYLGFQPQYDSEKERKIHYYKALMGYRTAAERAKEVLDAEKKRIDAAFKRYNKDLGTMNEALAKAEDAENQAKNMQPPPEPELPEAPDQVDPESPSPQESPEPSQTPPQNQANGGDAGGGAGKNDRSPATAPEPGQPLQASPLQLPQPAEEAQVPEGLGPKLAATANAVLGALSNTPFDIGELLKNFRGGAEPQPVNRGGERAFTSNRQANNAPGASTVPGNIADTGAKGVDAGAQAAAPGGGAPGVGPSAKGGEGGGDVMGGRGEDDMGGGGRVKNQFAERVDYGIGSEGDGNTIAADTSGGPANNAAAAAAAQIVIGPAGKTAVAKAEKTGAYGIMGYVGSFGERCLERGEGERFAMCSKAPKNFKEALAKAEMKKTEPSDVSPTVDDNATARAPANEWGSPSSASIGETIRGLTEGRETDAVTM